MMHLSPCVEYLTDDCESVIEHVLVDEPDNINNSTATDEGETSSVWFLEVQI